jgi:general secretion pathway protein D
VIVSPYPADRRLPRILRRNTVIARVLLVGVLSGCNPTGPASPPEGADTAPAVTSQSLAPTALSGDTSGGAIALGRGPSAYRSVGSPEIVLGSGQFVGPASSAPGGQQVALVGSDVTLDFTNVDVRDVLKSVLGDLLKLSYTVDPAVQGSITLQTGRPIPRSSVVDVLNTTLGLSGVALVDHDGLYLAVPVANAARQAPVDSAVGFVTRIVPLQYVSANDLMPALEPLVPPGATLKADPSRNILIVSGSARDVSGIMANIATFDVDYLRGLSFALLPLSNGRAKDVANDVSNLIRSSGPSVADMVKVVPVERMNAILVTSMQPSYLQRVRAWVERFDRGDGRGDQQLFVYRVQNGRATDIARVLRRALGVDQADTSRGDQDTNSSDTGDTTPPAAGTTSPSGLSTVQSALAGSPSTGSSASSTPTPGSPALTSDALASVGTAAALTGGGSGGGGGPVSDVRVTADRANNALIVTATAQEYAPIQAALEKLDIPPLQVLIDATVAEVTLNNQLSYGLQYYFNSGVFKGVFSPTVPLGQTSAITQAGNFPGFGLLNGFNFAYSSNGTNIVLQALSAVTTVRVLSSPNLLVLNNGTARLQVGDQVPIATQSATSTLTDTAQTVNSINYKDTGVILNITPRVNASGLVLLDMSEEISQPGSTTSSSLNSPTISQRRVTSSVAVNDGQTIGLAGLIQDRTSNGRSGLPWLKDLPVVGFLFGYTNNTSARTELIMLITPHVIRNREEGDAVTEELRRKLRLTVPIVSRLRQ